jgi:hypothetical protein
MAKGYWQVMGLLSSTLSPSECLRIVCVRAFLADARHEKEKDPKPGAFSYSRGCALALEQAQHTLLGGIRLCQHRHGCLLEDLRLGKVSAFCREVSVLDARTASFKVRRDVRQVRHGAVEAVGNRTKVGTLREVLPFPQRSD